MCSGRTSANDTTFDRPKLNFFRYPNPEQIDPTRPADDRSSLSLVTSRQNAGKAWTKSGDAQSVSRLPIMIQHIFYFVPVHATLDWLTQHFLLIYLPLLDRDDGDRGQSITAESDLMQNMESLSFQPSHFLFRTTMTPVLIEVISRYLVSS